MDLLPIKIIHVRKRFRGSSVIGVVSRQNERVKIKHVKFSSTRTHTLRKGRKRGPVMRCSCLCLS